MAAITVTFKEIVAANGIREEKVTDKYGRSAVRFSLKTASGKTRSAVVVTLPKAYADKYPDEGRYMVNLDPTGQFLGRCDNTETYTFRNDAKLRALGAIILDKNS